MNTVLAIDTTTEKCTLAISVNGEIASIKASGSNSHADEILSLLDTLLAKAKITLNDIHCIALANGPGSFTGIRIGLSVVQGLAYGLNVPVICVGSLELMAYQIATHNVNIHRSEIKALCPAIDARMGDVYWQHFEYDVAPSKGITKNLIVLTPKGAAQVSKPDLLQAQWDASSNILLGGDGWRCDGLTTNTTSWFDLTTFNSAESLLAIAKTKIEQGETMSVFDIEPYYVRTEITWKKRKRIRS